MKITSGSIVALAASIVLTPIHTVLAQTEIRSPANTTPFEFWGEYSEFTWADYFPLTAVSIVDPPKLGAIAVLTAFSVDGAEQAGELANVWSKIISGEASFAVQGENGKFVMIPAQFDWVQGCETQFCLDLLEPSSASATAIAGSIIGHDIRSDSLWVLSTTESKWNIPSSQAVISWNYLQTLAPIEGFSPKDPVTR